MQESQGRVGIQFEELLGALANESGAGSETRQGFVSTSPVSSPPASSLLGVELRAPALEASSQQDPAS